MNLLPPLLGAGLLVVPLKGPAKIPPALRYGKLPLRSGRIFPADPVGSPAGSQGQLGAVPGEFREGIIQGHCPVTSHRIRVPPVGWLKTNHVARPIPALLGVPQIFIDHCARRPTKDSALVFVLLVSRVLRGVVRAPPVDEVQRGSEGRPHYVTRTRPPFRNTTLPPSPFGCGTVGGRKGLCQERAILGGPASHFSRWASARRGSPLPSSIGAMALRQPIGSSRKKGVMGRCLSKA